MLENQNQCHCVHAANKREEIKKQPEIQIEFQKNGIKSTSRTNGHKERTKGRHGSMLCLAQCYSTSYFNVIYHFVSFLDIGLIYCNFQDGSIYGRPGAASTWSPMVTFSTRMAAPIPAGSPGDALGPTRKPSGAKLPYASGTDGQSTSEAHTTTQLLTTLLSMILGSFKWILWASTRQQRVQRLEGSLWWRRRRPSSLLPLTRRCCSRPGATSSCAVCLTEDTDRDLERRFIQ